MRVRLVNSKHLNVENYSFDLVLFASMFCAFALYSVELLLVSWGIHSDVPKYMNFIRVFAYGFLLIEYLLYKKINTNFVIYCILYILILGINSIIYTENAIYIKEMISYFLYTIFPIMLTIVYCDDAETYLDYLHKISYFLIARVFVEVILRSTSGNVEFITFGTTTSTGMSMTYQTIIGWTVITYYAFRNKKILDIVLSVVTAFLYVTFGTRGAVLIIVAFLVYMVFRTENIKKRRWLIFFTLLMGIVVFLWRDLIISSLINVLSNKGIVTYNMSKISLYGFESGSRTRIWMDMKALIEENWLFGAGIGADRAFYHNSGMYAHNLFIELMLDFGIVLGISVSVILVLILIRGCFSKRIGRMKKDLFSVFAITGFMLLLVSDSIYSTYFLFAAFSVGLIEDKDGTVEKRVYGTFVGENLSNL